MSVVPILSTLGVSAMLTFGLSHNTHQKTNSMSQINASNVATILNLTDTIRHTFVIDDNNSITLLLNQFQTLNGGIEKYLQYNRCDGNEYTIYVRDDHYQVSIVDNKNETVVWYNVTIGSNNNESNDDDDDVKEHVPTVQEILKRIQSQGLITPFKTDDGIVYKGDCV